MGLDTKKRNQRQSRWIKAHRDRIAITFPKGTREKLEKAAGAEGLTISQFVTRAVYKWLEDNKI
ncbi:MAG: hypothetical protein Q4B86_07225 [Eubacteriales bacterium]|nr:hypothetical protein [Eubacteriales bacterium]